MKRLELDLQRAKSLLPTKAISQGDYDKAQGDRDEAAAALDVAVAAMNSAKENLEYTTVRAKFAGRISRQMVDPGNMVRANDTKLTTLVSNNLLYVYFDIDERSTIKIRRLSTRATSPPRDTARLRSVTAWPTKKAFHGRPA